MQSSWNGRRYDSNCRNGKKYFLIVEKSGVIKKKKTTILEIVSLLDKTIFVFAQNRNLIERKYIYFLEEYKRYRYIY